ncbi:hypothetical protein EO92_18065 [Methanosarcina sp. 2.H.A.1B.4]|nr:hypothetical protein EO92_18065 [Methanosarcina sp. 2.H.A.1B.4]
MDPPADQTAGKIYGNKKTRKHGGERSSKMQYGGTVSEKLPAPLNFLSLQSALLSVCSSLSLPFSRSAFLSVCSFCSVLYRLFINEIFNRDFPVFIFDFSTA